MGSPGFRKRSRKKKRNEGGLGTEPFKMYFYRERKKKILKRDLLKALTFETTRSGKLKK